jgi:hypothetical protein
MASTRFTRNAFKRAAVATPVAAGNGAKVPNVHVPATIGTADEFLWNLEFTHFEKPSFSNYEQF